jgi:hypothetical protein
MAVADGCQCPALAAGTRLTLLWLTKIKPSLFQAQAPQEVAAPQDQLSVCAIA